MRIQKVKVTKQGKIRLEYEIMRHSGEYDEYAMTASDKARPEFYDAIADLAPYVIEICELPETDTPKITVKGVSFNYAGEDQTMGAVIISQRLLKHTNCALNLITPNKIEDYYGESGDPNQLLPSECVKVLHRIQEECELYINGERAQGQLFDGK